MNDKKLIRRSVREVLAMAPDYGKNESFIHRAVNSLYNGGVHPQETADAIAWNLSEKLVRAEPDDEADAWIYYITAAGIARNKQ